MSSIVERCSDHPCVAARAVRAWWALPLLALTLLGWAPSAFAQPANDNFSAAWVLSGGFGATNGSTVNATIEPGEPFHYDIHRGRSVWFRWTAPTTGFVTFDTAGSSFDTIMAAYTGNTLGSLAQIASNDDTFFLDSQVVFLGVAGTEYKIAVDGYFAASGFYRLNWIQEGATNPPPLAPDAVEFASANVGVDEALPGYVTVSVLGGGGFTNTVTIDYYTTDGSAVAGIDYLSVSNTLTFQPGDTVKTFTIPINDNFIQDSNRTINIHLANPSAGAVLTASSNSIVTIVDNETVPFISEAGVFSIVANAGVAAVVSENETFTAPFGNIVRTIQTPDRNVPGALVTVRRSAPASGKVLVDYYTTNSFIFGNTNVGSAQPNFDYTPVSGTLVFDDYQMMANFIVPILNNGFFGTNSVLGGSVYFDVVLHNARPAPEEDPAVIIPMVSVDRARVQINKINNTDLFSIERKTYRVDEYANFDQGGSNVVNGVRQLYVDVILPGGGPGRVNLHIDVGAYSYLLLPGSDYADDDNETWDSTLHTDGAPPVLNLRDYELVSGGTTIELVFGNGQTRQNTRIRVLADDVVEFNEDIRIRLTPIPGQPGVNPLGSLATATILFDDQPAGAADREWNPEGVIYTNPRFYTTPGADSTVAAVAVQPDNRTIIGGSFTHYNSVARNHIARIEPDGSLDVTFNPGGGADGSVTAIALYPTNSPDFGKVIIGGAFNAFNGARRNGIARLNANGSLDLTFAPGNGADGIVRAVAVQNDGKILVAGDFTTFNDISFNGIVRLNPDGSVDSGFNPGLNPYFGPNGSIWTIAVREFAANARQIYVAGDFTSFTDQPRMHLARLLDDGSVDLTFDPGLGTDGAIYATALQADGKLLIGGAFYMYHTFERSALARINPDGSLDESYVVGAGADDSIYTIAIQPDGKAVIGGIFNHYNTTRRMGLARLFTTGALDTSFMDSAYNHFAGLPRTFSFDSPSFVRSLAIDTNGHVMIGGSFTNVGGNLSIHYPLSPNASESINGRTNGHNSGAHRSAPFTRQDKTTRFNIARILGGYTPGPGNIEIDPASLPFTINENSSLHHITMRRVDGRLGGIGVTLSTTDNTAVSPADFSPSINAQSWPQGMADRIAVGPVISPESVGLVRRTTFPVPINNDDLAEGDETFGLVVSNAFGNIMLGGEEIPLGAAFGWHQRALATIADNDFSYGTFNFKVVNYITTEDPVLAEISVIRTNGSHGSVAVDWYTRTNSPHSTATSGVDYLARGGTLVFAHGEVEKTFKVQLLDNPEVEQDEIVSLVLTNASGGAKLHGGATFLTSTLTIVDDDYLPGRLQFTADTFTNSENQVSALITIQRSGGALQSTHVNVWTAPGGTATTGLDYVYSTNSFSWTNTDSTARTFIVPLLTDGIVEGPESVLLRLSSADPSALGSRSNAVLWITDADSYGALAFNQTAYVGDENGNPATITVTRSGGSSGAASVWYATRPITAMPGVDYVTTSNRLDFANGEFSKTFQVPLLDNTVPDGERTLELSLFAPVNATLGTVTNVVLTIVDNESVNLAAGSLDTTFSAQAAANAAVYALVQQQDGRIVMAGDFTQVNNVPRNRLARLRTDGTLDSTFDIGPGANNSIRTLALQSDGRLLIGGFFSSVNGTNRNAVARLSTDGQLDAFFNPGSGADNAVYAVVVQPDDKVLVGGSFSTFNGVTRPGLVRLDQHGSVDATFTIGAAGFDGTVYAIAVQNDGKILVGGDFVKFNGNPRRNLVRLNANGTVDNTFADLLVDAPVRAIHVESNGRIIIGGSFTNISGIGRQYLARLSSSGVVDPTFLPGNDLASSGADNTVYAIKQQVDGKLIVVGDFRRFNGVTRSGITRLNIENGSNDPTINFGAGANGFVSAVVIQPDRRIVIGGGFTQYDEQPRQHVARIYGGSIVGPGSLEFSQPVYLVNEQGTNAVITVRRVGGTTGSVAVDYATFEGSAIAGVDFLPVSGTLTSFTEGETRGTFTVPIIGNSSLEGDRELFLVLENYVGATAGPQPFARLVIVDDENAVGFSVPYYTVNESPVSGNATVSLVRRGSTNSAFTVEIASVNGTATAGLDYIPTNRVVSFLPGERFKNFNVRILNDALIEGNETFSLVLSNATGLTSLDSISSATVTIMDDDSAAGQFLFSTNNFVVDEFGGQAVVTVLRTNGSRGIVSVLLSTGNGTAVSGADYISTNHVVTFADGETAKSVAFPIIDDGIAEPDETVLLTLSSPNNGTSILVSNSVVTISDNETPSSIAFQSAGFFVAENGGMAVINVVRSGNRSSVVSVDFTTGAGSATPGVDYTPVTTTVTFQKHEVLQTILIPVSDDMVSEGPETVALSLSNLQSTSAASLGLASATLTIVENDTAIRFASSVFTVLENETNAVITVVREGDSTAAISVDYTTRTGGNAIAGLDYRNTAGTLTWAAGDSAPKTFLVQVIDNTSLSAHRSFLVSLTNLVGAAASLESPSNAVVTIIDDELGTPVSGVVDPSFAGDIGANLPVHAVTFDAQQRVIAGGEFTLMHGYPVNRITRLTTNGAVDVRFNVGSGADNTVYSVASAPSNLVYIAGAFTNVNGLINPGVARLLDNGNVDTNFNIGFGANAPVYAVAPFGDGVFVAGDFTLFNGTTAGRVALLTSTGTVDTAFNSTVGANGSIRAIAVQTNGQVIIGGDFSAVNVTNAANRLARLNPDGSVDITFNTGLGADALVRSIAVQPDGKILIGGEFLTVNGSPRGHVARLNSDGSVDVTFNPGFGASSDVRSIALQADGRVVVVGTFTSFDGNAFRRIARLNPNGSLDTFFAIGSGADGAVNSVATYSIPAPVVCDPPIRAVLTFDALSATNFAGISNYTENCVSFFGPTGGVFHAVSNVVSGGTAAQLLAADGQLLELNVGGRPFTLLSINFLNLSGPVIVTSSLGGSAAVLQTGVTFFDSTFANVQWVRIQAPAGGAVTIDDIVVFSSPAPMTLPTDRIAVGGDFININGVPKHRVAVLDYSGAVDSWFDPGAIATHSVFAIDTHTNVLQPNLVGKVIAGGDFLALVGAEGVSYLGRLNIDGTIDKTFTSGFGPSGPVRAVAIQPDGKTIIGGSFTNYDLVPRSYLARVNVDGTLDTTFNIGVGVDNSVLALALQPDGRTVIGGAFTHIYGAPRSFIGRVNPNGTVDTNFVSSANGTVRAVALQPDGKVLIGGDFTTVNGVARGGIARLNTNGTIDTTFSPAAVNGSVNAIAIAADGRVLVGGAFTQIGGNAAPRLAQLNADGSFDSSFNVGSGANDYVSAIEVQSDGRILVGGNFTMFNGQVRNRLLRLNSDGSFDPGVNFGTGANNFVSAIALQTYDDKILVGGAFTRFDEEVRIGIARLFNGDNDGSGVIEFATTRYTVNESAGTATLTVARRGGTYGTVTVNYATANGTASAPADYSASSGTLTFAQAESVKYITVPIVDNVAMTGDRTFNVTLSSPTGGAVLGSGSTAEVTIMDNDSIISFTTDAYTVSEAGIAARITVVRDGGLTDAVSVDYATGTNGTATAGVDFTERRSTLVFNPGVRVLTFDVPVVNDTENEFNETVPLSLFNLRGAPGTILGLTSATLTIVENDFAAGVIGFSTNSYVTNEDGISIRIDVIRTNGFAGVATVAFATDTNSAQAGVDFFPTNGTLTFNDGQTTASFVVRLIDDSVQDGTKRVPLRLFGVTGGATLGLAAAELVIIDNEAPGEFALSALTYSVSETGRFAVVSVLRNAGNLGNVTVTFQTSGGSAAAGADYTAINTVLNFAAGQNSTNVLIPIHDDALIEGTETVGLLLSNPTGGAIVAPGQGAAILSIIDDEVSVSFDQVTYAVIESWTNLIVSVSRLGDTNVGFSVAVSTADGTATAFNDYLPVITTLNFAPGETNKLFVVEIRDDTLAEGNEFFGMALSSPTAGVRLGANVAAQVMIVDNDIGFSFSSAVYNVGESTNLLTITVNRSGDPLPPASVDFGTRDGSATAGFDYISSTGRLVFASGVTSLTFNVNIINDFQVEGNETVNLFLANPSPGANLVGQSAALINILDDDTSIYFERTAYIENEKNTNAVITILRTGVTATPASVQFRTTNGTALAGVDYTPVTVTLNWPAGDTSPRTVLVPITDDGTPDGPETVRLVLENAVGGTVDPLNGAAILTITDQGGAIAFAASSYTVVETDGNAVLSLVRTGGTNGVVTVDWVVQGGTAIAGQDFPTSSGTVTFSEGQTAQSILLPVNHDGVVEGVEFLNVTLINARGGARVGSPANASLRIVDGDAGVILGAGAALVAESLNTNNVIESNEVVTVLLGLRNNGVINDTITATLVYSNGTSVMPTNAQAATNLQQQSYGELIAGGSAVSRPFTFRAVGTNGARLDITLLITNSAGVFLGDVTFSYTIGRHIVPFGNAGVITIPVAGAANPYPATLTVSGVNGPVNKLTVTLFNMSHDYPDDIDMVLVAPDGRHVMLMSDSGLGGPGTANALRNVTLTFDDEAEFQLPDSGVIGTNQVYRPANHGVLTDPFPSGGPAAPFSTSLSTFNGANPNGVWSLYIHDDSPQYGGIIAGGWSLNIQTADPVIAGADLSIAVVDSADPVLTNGTVTYTISVTNHGPAAASSVTVTNTLPAGATFLSSVPGRSGSGNTVILSFGNLPIGVGTNGTITITAPGIPGAITLEARAGAGEADLNPGNNFASVRTTVLESTVLPAPVLFSARKGDNLILSWQHSTNVVLQSKSLLGSPWNGATNNVVISNGVGTVTVPLSTGSSFYRLKRQ